MKIYDKDVYNRQEEIRNVVIIIVTFLLGFFVGYIANILTHKGIEEEIIINTLAPNNTINIIENNKTNEINEIVN